MKKITLKIQDMHCTSCAMNIDGDLEDYVSGVKRAETNYAKQTCNVEYDEKKTNEKKIIEQIKKTGYTASLEN